MRRTLRWRPATFAATFVLAGAASSTAIASPGAVFTETNGATGNAVQQFDRADNGQLTPAGTFPTGGLGLASPGGRQGAVVLSRDGDTVYAVNTGSDSVTAFHRTRTGLAPIGTVRSGGVAPVSVAERDGRVYVLNSGDTPSRGTPSVATFLAGPAGRLLPIPIGVRALTPGADGTAQVSVTPDGDRLIVTERVSNRIESLDLDRFGRPGTPVVSASSGATPFGFAFAPGGTLVVSEAGASTVSSYRVGFAGRLAPITPSLPVNQGAACWVAVSPDGRFAYTGNATGSISGFAIIRNGALNPLNADGATAVTPAAFTPRDLAFDPSGRYLYAVSPGGLVTGYHVTRDGALQPITTAPAAAGLTGIAVS